MGKLALRKPYKILFMPFNLLASLIAWALFSVSFREAWTGDLEPIKKKEK